MTTTTTGSSLEHRIGQDGIVKLRIRHGEIRLRGIDGEHVRVRDRGGHDLAALFSIELGDGSVALSTGGDGDGVERHGHGSSIDIEVDVPRRVTLVVETSSAEIVADGLLGDQRYRTTSGEITLRGVSGVIAIEAVSGDVDIAATDATDVSVRTVSGDVEIRAAMLHSLQATTTSGDLKVAGDLAGPGPFAIETVSGDALLAPAGDVRIEMTSVSGDLSSDLGTRTDRGRGRRTVVVGTGGPSLTYRSMSGDLHVVRPMPVPPLVDARPVPPEPSAPPAPAAPGDAPTDGGSVKPVGAATRPGIQNGAIAAAYEGARLRILRSLERSEIDVAEAGRRFEALDAGDPVDTADAVDPTSQTTRVPIVDSSDA